MTEPSASLMHWSWSIRSKPLQDWESLDAQAFMDFIMRPPITWVTTPGCSRYSKKACQNFADKPLDPEWRPAAVASHIEGIDFDTPLLPES